jgi:hypothetical protein
MSRYEINLVIRISRAIPIGFMLVTLLWSSAAGLDWRDLDISDENSALRKGIETGKILDAGEWGAKTFPVLAKEIWQDNIHQAKKLPYPLSPYQKKWLSAWLEKWGINPDDIQIVYEARLLNNHKILDQWPIAIMDELAGQTFGNTIYLGQPHKSKDGNLLVLLSHEAFHIKQYQELGSIAEFGRKYTQGYVESFFSYENNPMEVEAYNAQDQFRQWLCSQEGWSCD